MNLRRMLVTCMLGLAMVIASSAFAQGTDDSKPGRRNKPRPATDADPMLEENSDPGMLAGPTVEDEASEGSNNPMNSPNNPARRRANDQNIPMRQWMEVIRNVGLTDEQRQQVDAIIADFQTAQRNFQTEHGEEMQQLQRQARAARESGKEPDPAMREKLQMLEAAMPKQIEYQKRVWEKLTAEQQALARTKLAELEKRMQEQRRRGAAGAGAGAGAAPSGGGGGAPASQQPQQPQRTAPRGRTSAQPATDTGSEGLSPSGQPDRAAPQEAPADPDEMSGMGMTDAAPKAVPADAPAAPVRERAAAAAARRRGDDAGIDMAELDPAGRQRVQFLLAHLSAGRAGNAPTDEEKTFKFVEDQ